MSLEISKEQMSKLRNPYSYDRCPSCGNPKMKYATLCRSCRFARPQISQPDDPAIRHIALTRGQVAIVDAADYEWLTQWLWFADWSPCTQSFYARRNVTRKGTKTPILMHRLILGLSVGDKRTGDHVDPSATLDNRRINLRAATHGENTRNARLRKDNRSGLKGVKQRGARWAAAIKVNGRNLWLGTFDSAADAHAAYCDASSKFHKEFGRTQ